MAIEHHFKARAVAGRAALVIVSEHDHDTSTDMLRGMVTGFLLALAEVSGWDSALAEVNRIARESRAPVNAGKPKLEIVREDVA